MIYHAAVLTHVRELNLAVIVLVELPIENPLCTFFAGSKLAATWFIVTYLTQIRILEILKIHVLKNL